MPESRPTITMAWHLARWRHAAPGPRGFAIGGLVALLLVLPLHRLGLGDSWSAATRMPLTFASLVLPFLVGRDTAARDELEFWLLSKGISPADWAFSKWKADLVPLAAVITGWMSVLLIAAVAYGEQVSLSSTLATLATLFAIAMVVSVLLFGLAASGSPNAAELALLLLILCLFAPLLADRLHPLLRGALRFGLPPILPISELRGSIEAGAWRPALRLALHAITWCALVMLLATTVLSRRVPRP